MCVCYDAFVRTTLDISDDAYQIAKTVAREENRSLGSVVSDFIIGRYNPPPHPQLGLRSFLPFTSVDA